MSTPQTVRLPSGVDLPDDCVDRRCDLLILGSEGGTNVGGSFRRAADSCGVSCRFIDTSAAAGKWRISRALCWRLMDRRPVYLDRLSDQVVRACAESRPKWLLSTGTAPLTARALKAIGELGVTRVNYSTDDPWSDHRRSTWFLEALRRYDVIFTPRRANIRDFLEHGCKRVEYLPFAYDPQLWSAPDSPNAREPETDVLFVGGADSDRAPLLAALANSGLRLGLCGQYWSRFPELRPHAMGQVRPEGVREASHRAAISLILTRKSNRDGHVMRTFEAAALRSCMLVEDTEEHKEILGKHGDCVYYFSTPSEMVARAKELRSNPAERARLANAVCRRITESDNTYGDRLKAMIGAL